MQSLSLEPIMDMTCRFARIVETIILSGSMLVLGVLMSSFILKRTFFFKDYDTIMAIIKHFFLEHFLISFPTRVSESSQPACAVLFIFLVELRRLVIDLLSRELSLTMTPDSIRACALRSRRVAFLFRFADEVVHSFRRCSRALGVVAFCTPSFLAPAWHAGSGTPREMGGDISLRVGYWFQKSQCINR